MTEQVLAMSPATYEVVKPMVDEFIRTNRPATMWVELDSSYPLGTITIWERGDWERRNDPPPAELQAIFDQLNAMRP